MDGRLAANLLPSEDRFFLASWPLMSPEGPPPNGLEALGAGMLHLDRDLGQGWHCPFIFPPAPTAFAASLPHEPQLLLSTTIHVTGDNDDGVNGILCRESARHPLPGERTAPEMPLSGPPAESAGSGPQLPFRWVVHSMPRWWKATPPMMEPRSAIALHYAEHHPRSEIGKKGHE